MSHMLAGTIEPQQKALGIHRVSASTIDNRQACHALELAIMASSPTIPINTRMNKLTLLRSTPYQISYSYHHRIVANGAKEQQETSGAL